MEDNVLERTHESLIEKRQTLQQWIETTPEAKKQQQLGPADEGGVEACLECLDTAIEKAENQSLGICKVCHDYVDSSLLEMDFTAEVCLDHLSTEEIRALEAELELANAIQKAMLPQQAPQLPGLDVDYYSKPAQIVSGDYFNFINFRDHTTGLVVADVMGHGVSASLLMSSVHTLLHTLIPESNSAAKVLEHINRLFVHNIRFTTFVTIFVAQYDPRARTLTYSNAGHNPPLHYRRKNGPLRANNWLNPTGPAIGLVEGFRITEKTLPMEPDDVLLVYTDGITEATDPGGEQFGTQRLADVVQRDWEAPPREIIQALRRELYSHTQGSPLDDDTTLVVGRVK